jgi:membrane protein DedA with SNARE-associated domain
LSPSEVKSGPLVPRNKILLAVAAATFIVGLLQAVDLVELPFGQIFEAVSGSLVSASSLGTLMANYGYISLFALMATESASLPIPSEVVLPLAGYLVYTGAMNFWVAVGVSTLASLVGALVDYYLAIKLGRPFVVDLLKLFRLHKGALDRAEKWFARSGQWTVFAARFIPGLRTIISLPAGLFEMKIRPFIAMTLAGCFAWSVILIYAGQIAASQVSSPGWSTVFESSSEVADYLSALVAIVSAAYILYYSYPRMAGRSTRPTSESVPPSASPS